jgi:TrmH family RNA methyltransferase
MSGPTIDPPITSTANPRVKAWLRLRDRPERERTGRTLVDGAREIGRAVAAGADVEEVVVSPLAAEAEPELLRAVASAGIRTVAVSDAIAARLTFGDRGDGLVAIVRIPDLALERVELPDAALVIVLEGLEKPGNLGAILRTADAVGADAVIAAEPRTDLFNPNAIRASLGAIFSVQVAAGPSQAVASWCRTVGLRILAARVDGPVVYSQADLTGAVAIVLGAETVGLGDAWRSSDVLAIRLPMHGLVDSLNVSAAAAVLLYEARRQRDAGRRPS